ncbi:MAG: type IV secretion system protein [Synergistaceae bacterium]|jgi:type IV secretion system protein VirB5|nr:type IV secretion system protein [Synergistaceae bacterium]
MKDAKEMDHIVDTNPFSVGRTEYADRYGHLSKNAAQWRRISLALLICCVACVFAVIYAAGRITVVPYVIQVDEHGYEIAIEPVSASKVDARLIISHIGRYVWNMRTVFNDPEAQLHLMNFVYNSTPVNTAAEKKYQEHFNENNPIVIGETETVSVTVNSVLSMSPESWQAEWTEERYTVGGNRVSTKRYRGIFTAAVVTPRTMQEIIINPLGIFITDFNISEVI